VAYLAFFISRLPAGVHLKVMTGLKSLLTLSLVYFTLQLFNPNSPSLLLSFVGFKNYLLYPPLAFVVPYMFSSSTDLENKLRRYALIMIPFAALGLVQFALGPDHWINGYLSHDSENLRQAAMFGTAEFTKARTSGTFSYVSGFATFLTVLFCLGVGLATTHKWRISGNSWALLLLGVTTAAIFTTGSRGPIYGLIITSPLMFFIWRMGGLISLKTALRIGVALAIVSAAVTLIASNAIEAYNYRAEHSDDPIVRIFSPVTEAYGVLFLAPVIGAGMASTASSAITIVGTDSWWWLQGVFVESETARVLQETGIIGFILIYAARAWLLIKAITLGIQFRTPIYVAMSGVIAAFFTQFAVGTVINNPTAGIYYWFSAGLLFAMYRLEVLEARAPAGLGTHQVNKASGARELARPVGASGQLGIPLV